MEFELSLVSIFLIIMLISDVAPKIFNFNNEDTKNITYEVVEVIETKNTILIKNPDSNKIRITVEEIKEK